MLLPTMGNHGWLRCHFTNLWLTMVDHGLEKLCQTMVNHGWLWFKKALPNHGQPWLTMIDWPTMVDFWVSFSAFSQWKPHGRTMASQTEAGTSTLSIQNRHKVSLLTWDSFVQTGVQWLHKGKFQSLQTFIKMSICVKPIFLYRHILWCQESKVGSVWKWNN